MNTKMEKEDGEMSDDNEMLVDEEDTTYKVEDSTVLYKTEKNGIIVQKLEKVDALKLEERAKRFGLNLTGNKVITQKQIDELYANFGIESGNERHFRFDTLYLHGVDGLSTKEIFKYLQDYKPISLEWIDEISCNVVCQDHISVALALLVHSREIKNEELKAMLGDTSNCHWREGMPHPKKDLILMRFGTNGDIKGVKKIPEKLNDNYNKKINSLTKNPWGDLCRSWGVYDHQEVFTCALPKNDYENDIEEEEEPRQIIQPKNKKLAMRLGKRHLDSDNYRNDQSDNSDSESEWKVKSKTPRMRMHADDEESKLKKKQAKSPLEVNDNYPPLSIEVVNSNTNFIKREATKLSDKFKYHNVEKQVKSIRSRLGDKIGHVEQFSGDESSTENVESNVLSKVQKVKEKNSNSVWSRLEIKQNNTSDHSDLRQILKSRGKTSKGNDLRDRISKSKKSNLRIEIDNTFISK